MFSVCHYLSKLAADPFYAEYKKVEFISFLSLFIENVCSCLLMDIKERLQNYLFPSFSSSLVAAPPPPACLPSELQILVPLVFPRYFVSVVILKFDEHENFLDFLRWEKKN